MSSIGQILNTAKEALAAHQVAIDVTGTNVSNASSAGYSRQRAVIVPRTSSEASGNDLRGGVTVETIQRLYDQFVEAQISEHSSLLSYSDTQKNTLDQIEAVFNETDGEGLSAAMSRFWKAWEDLSANPAGDVERMVVISAADNLSATFREQANRLTDIQDSLNTKVTADVTLLNSYLDGIADLTYKIMQTGTGGNNVNSLLDERAELLKKVSQMVDVQYVQGSDLSMDIFLSNGKALVLGDRSWDLNTVRNNTTGFNDVVLAEDPTFSLNSAIHSGELGALLEARDTTAQSYLQDLNNLAGTLVDQVNTRHAAGFDLYGNLGGRFFADVTEAAGMAVDGAIAADRKRIAASSTVNGDGDNASSMARLQTALVMSGNTTSLSGYYGSLVGRIGEDTAAVERIFNQRTAVMTTLNTQKEQVSGVSIDEEMINLMKYQMGYSAAGKMVTTANELMDTLLELIK
jgi:flagellar hook-associated protein 1 FlgK